MFHVSMFLQQPIRHTTGKINITVIHSSVCIWLLDTLWVVFILKCHWHKSKILMLLKWSNPYWILLQNVCRRIFNCSKKIIWFIILKVANTSLHIVNKFSIFYYRLIYLNSFILHFLLLFELILENKTHWYVQMNIKSTLLHRKD